MGLASVIKVWPAILVLLGFLHKRSKKLIMTSIATVALLRAVSLPFLGLSTFREFIGRFLTFQTFFIPPKEAILMPVMWDSNVSPTLIILKFATLLSLNVSSLV